METLFVSYDFFQIIVVAQLESKWSPKYGVVATLFIQVQKHFEKMMGMYLCHLMPISYITFTTAASDIGKKIVM